MNSNHHIAIIGPTDMVAGFRTLGIEAINATSGIEALAALRRLRQNPDRQYAVVCLIEELFTNIDPVEFEKATTSALPAVVLLPGTGGASGVALARLRRLAERAVGSAII
jgi:vacuolar-type H+-ATPase subunit F/Vma7